VTGEEIVSGVVLALAAALFAAGGVQASGYFPAEARPRALRGSGGRLAIAGLLLALLLLAAVAVRFAVDRLDWPPAVIAAGLGILAGPLLWQRLAPAGLDRPLGVLASSSFVLASAAGLALWTGAAEN